MLLSMTGFSSKSATIDIPEVGTVGISVEIKTINSRFFEATCKLPNSLNSLEVDIVNLLQKKLLRGRLYLTVRFTGDNEILSHITPSMKNIEEYLETVANIKSKFGLQGDLTLQDLLLLPNVFVATRGDLSVDGQKAILTVVDQAAQVLIAVRAEEGARLEKDLLERFKICGQKIQQIKQGSEVLLDKLKKECEQKRVVVEQGDDLARLQLDDLYGQLNKADVHEEITRFNSHLKSVEALFAAKQDDKGKRLDFILQELLRETNTTMAKCSDFDISSLCVDIKVELEKAREQVQNIV